MAEEHTEHDWKILKVESYSELTLRYRCVCGAEIVHPSQSAAPPKRIIKKEKT